MASVDVHVLAANLEEQFWDVDPVQAAELAEAFTCVFGIGGVCLEAVLRVMTNEALALLVQKNAFRNQAFEELMVRRYERRLTGFFFKKLCELPTSQNGGNLRGMAVDLMQDIHVKLLAGALRKFDPDVGEFEPWLFSVCHNHLKGVRRRAAPVTVPAENLTHWVDDDLQSPEEEAITHEFQQAEEKAFNDAFSRLPAEERVLLRLRLDGCGPPEIAAQTNLPIKKVYRLLHRAKQRLRDFLGLPGDRAG